MSTKHVVALVCFIVAALLAVIAAILSAVPPGEPARGILSHLALAFVALGLAVEVS